MISPNDPRFIDAFMDMAQAQDDEMLEVFASATDADFAGVSTRDEMVYTEARHNAHQREGRTTMAFRTAADAGKLTLAPLTLSDQEASILIAILDHWLDDQFAIMEHPVYQDLADALSAGTRTFDGPDLQRVAEMAAFGAYLARALGRLAAGPDPAAATAEADELKALLDRVAAACGADCSRITGL
jgi:hypothetical protein